MPTYIKEESLTLSRLNRNHKVKRSVNYIELTTDAGHEKLDVRLYHAGSLPHILACYETYIKDKPVPVEFEVRGDTLTFFAGNEFALCFLLKIKAISQATYDLAQICLQLDEHSPGQALRA